MQAAIDRVTKLTVMMADFTSKRRPTPEQSLPKFAGQKR
jgi:hypothetical protein